MFHVMFFEPRIPANTGNAIRLSAITGCVLHLVKPLGFDLSDAKLRRAGLDYHDLADVRIHENFEEAVAAVPGQRIYAFTTQAHENSYDIHYESDDVLLFGPEPDGLPAWVKTHPAITQQVRIPMLPARRSLNLSNSAAIAVYEAWRQHDFEGYR
ncbi:MAG: tRNA (cytidine(34)-2'-O)-methyltransferase [Bifidobacteriaceae bacterium]|jgi:tRNA (cytidine/uridine-2'-O-)-methyltransferase|nr:tRNA (cytidine(34)-2'-O)-methyltransferase [Bifidobacteriaceae bacterium]